MNGDELVALKALIRSIEKLPLDAALREIEASLSKSPPSGLKEELVLLRANYIAGQSSLGAKSDALRCLTTYIDEQPDEVGAGVLLFAGQYAAETGQLPLAVKYLDRCIQVSLEQQDSWYIDTAYMLRAYCRARNGEYVGARSDLSHLDEDVDLSWVSVDPPVSYRYVYDLVAAA